jgi:predicted nucleic acid-binding protein
VPSKKRPSPPPKPKPVPGLYTAPYLDSAIFIGWIMGEVEQDGTDRGKIGQHILTLAERGHYRLTISALTLAEVFKPKGYDPLKPAQNRGVLDYFEHDFFDMVMVDRDIGLKANEIAAMYGLNPNDAIHTACALRAGCDVILTWDEAFWKRNGIVPGIRIERPQPLGQQFLELADDGQ